MPTPTEEAVALGGDPKDLDRDDKPSMEALLAPRWDETFSAQGQDKPSSEPLAEEQKTAAEPKLPSAGKAPEADAKPPQPEVPKAETAAKAQTLDPDDELDKIPAPRDPVGKAGWETLKARTGEYRENYRKAQAQAQEALQRAEALQKERDELEKRSAQAPPETLQELEALRAHREQSEARLKTADAEINRLRAMEAVYDLENSATFKERYQEPLTHAFEGIMNDLGVVWGNSDEVKAALNDVKSQLGADRIDRGWFRAQVLNAKPYLEADPLTRQELVDKVSAFFRLRDQRDHEKAQVRAHPEKFTQALQEQEAAAQKERGDRYLAAVHRRESELRQTYGDFADLWDTSKAKDDADRERFELHNKEAREYRKKGEEYFKMLQDPDPENLGRAHMTMAAEAIRAVKLEKDLEALKSQQEKEAESHRVELERLKAENERLSKEHSRISGVRSVPAKAGGVSGTRTKPPVDIFTDNPFKNGTGWNE
jgi:hypothetical protein